MEEDLTGDKKPILISLFMDEKPDLKAFQLLKEEPLVLQEEPLNSTSGSDYDLNSSLKTQDRSRDRKQIVSLETVSACLAPTLKSLWEELQEDNQQEGSCKLLEQKQLPSIFSKDAVESRLVEDDQQERSCKLLEEKQLPSVFSKDAIGLKTKLIQPKLETSVERDVTVSGSSDFELVRREQNEANFKIEFGVKEEVPCTEALRVNVEVDPSNAHIEDDQAVETLTSTDDLSFHRELTNPEDTTSSDLSTPQIRRCFQEQPSPQSLQRQAMLDNEGNNSSLSDSLSTDIAIRRRTSNSRFEYKLNDIKGKRLDKNTEQSKFSLDSLSFRCDLCNKICVSIGALKYHLKTHLRRVWSIFNECDVCKKTFRNKGSLAKHRKAHFKNKLRTTTNINLNVPHVMKEETKLYTCDVCNGTFTIKNNLVRHMRRHLPSAVKPFSCKKCDKRFLWKNCLIEHMFVHVTLKSFACDVCNKSFKRKGHLMEHQQIHSRAKPYTCDVCHKHFTRKDNLIKHLVVHSASGIKPFKCDKCAKSFKWRSSLQAHKVVHGDAEPYKCKVCKKSFMWKSSYKGHIVIHYKLKPYICDICNERFTRKYELRKHILNH